MEIYDISQTMRPGIAVWPGDQVFRREWTMKISRGDSCNVSAVTMSTHTGTHLDAPFHFDDQGSDIASVSLRQCIGPARVVESFAEKCIDVPDLEQLELEGVKRILFKTRSSDLPEGQFAEDFVYLSEEGAEFLGRNGMLLVGTDAPSIDAYRSKDLPSHKTLLRHGVVILEGARLGEVPAGDYELICLPLKLDGLDGSPVRAMLRK